MAEEKYKPNDLLKINYKPPKNRGRIRTPNFVKALSATALFLRRSTIWTFQMRDHGSRWMKNGHCLTIGKNYPGRVEGSSEKVSNAANLYGCMRSMRCLCG